MSSVLTFARLFHGRWVSFPSNAFLMRRYGLLTGEEAGKAVVEILWGKHKGQYLVAWSELKRVHFAETAASYGPLSDVEALSLVGVLTEDELSALSDVMEILRAEGPHQTWDFSSPAVIPVLATCLAAFAMTFYRK